MQVKNMIVKEEEYKGVKYYSLFVIIDDKQYLIGTLKQREKFNYINCIHKEFKNN